MEAKKKTSRFSISSDEWMIISLIALFALVFIATLPRIISSSWFSNCVPPVQYLIFNLGFILLTIMLIGLPTSKLLKNKFHFWTTLRSGVSSWLIFSFVLDLWQPTFSYGPSGKLLVQSKEALAGTSVDYMLGWVYTHTILNSQSALAVLHIPFVGDFSILFFYIYFVTPVLSVIVGALIMKPQFLVRFFNERA